MAASWLVSTGGTVGGHGSLACGEFLGDSTAAETTGSAGECRGDSIQAADLDIGEFLGDMVIMGTGDNLLSFAWLVSMETGELDGGTKLTRPRPHPDITRPLNSCPSEAALAVAVLMFTGDTDRSLKYPGGLLNCILEISPCERPDALFVAWETVGGNPAIGGTTDDPPTTLVGKDAAWSSGDTVTWPIFDTVVALGDPATATGDVILAPNTPIATVTGDGICAADSPKAAVSGDVIWLATGTVAIETGDVSWLPADSNAIVMADVTWLLAGTVAIATGDVSWCATAIGEVMWLPDGPATAMPTCDASCPLSVDAVHIALFVPGCVFVDDDVSSSSSVSSPMSESASCEKDSKRKLHWSERVGCIFF